MFFYKITCSEKRSDQNVAISRDRLILRRRFLQNWILTSLSFSNDTQFVKIQYNQLEIITAISNQIPENSLKKQLAGTLGFLDPLVGGVMSKSVDLFYKRFFKENPL